MGRTSRITSNGIAAGKARASQSSKVGQRSASRRKKDREENVYAFDEGEEGETKKKDSERRFKGVSVYEYEPGDDFEDEEIEEDEAFEAEDYEKYGNIGNSDTKHSGGHAEDDDRELDDLFGEDGASRSSDGDDDEGAMEEDEAREAIANGLDPDLAESLGLIKKRKVRGAAAARASAAEESEFAVGGSSHGSGRELLLSDLTKPLASSKLLSTSTVTLINHSQSNKASVPLLGASKAAVIRQEQYDVTKAEVSRWQPEVKKNREAATLSFPLRAAPAPHVSTRTLTAELNPTTSLEADIASLLKGAGEENVQAFEALAMNKMSAEDVRARQAELAKMRSLLFFHEMKCRRIARIKSKKFAKVHKKKHAARDSNANDDIEYEEGADVDAAEQRERQRIKERMTLKHRNTSKWVTRQLHRGGGKEKGTRQAIEQQLRLAEDLKRKVDRLSASSDDGAGGSSAEDEGVESIREGIESHESSVQQKGIHSMAFMKRARDKGRAQALRLLDEMAAADSGDASACNDNAAPASGRRSLNNVNPARINKVLNNSEDCLGFHDDDVDNHDDDVNDDEGVDRELPDRPKRAKKMHCSASASSSGDHVHLQGGKGLQTLHASLGGSTSLTSTGAVTVQAAAAVPTSRTRSNRSKAAAITSSAADCVVSLVSLPQSNESAPAVADRPAAARQKQQQRGDDLNCDASSLPNPTVHASAKALNPWLAPPASSSSEQRSTSRSKLSSALDSAPAAEFISEPPNNQASTDIQEAFAFAAPEVAHDFEAEKRAEIEADAPKVRAFVSLAGWGSWTGAGCATDTYKDTLQARHNARVQEIQAKAAAARQDSGKAHVILNEKRNKKNVKYMADNFPHVFANREQYESSIRLPLGHEWNTMASHRSLVQPAVTVKAGKMIKPIAVPKSKLRSAGAEKVNIARKSFLK